MDAVGRCSGGGRGRGRRAESNAMHRGFRGGSGGFRGGFRIVLRGVPWGFRGVPWGFRGVPWGFRGGSTWLHNSKMYAFYYASWEH